VYTKANCLFIICSKVSNKAGHLGELMTTTEYQRYFARVNYYGFTNEEAYYCPKNMPLWMYRLEQEEGVSFVEFVNCGLSKGLRIADIARSIGEHYDTVYHWIRKLKITR